MKSTSFIGRLIYLFTGEKFDQLEEEKPDQEDLVHHPIFNEMRLWMLLKSGNLNITSPAKKKVSIAYLNIFFTNMESTLRDLIEGDIDTNVDTIREKLLCMLNDIQTESLQQGIPQIFIDKINVSNYKYFDMIFESISDICGSSFYTSPTNRMVSIFGIILFYIKIMTDDVEHTINAMNGHLESALKGTVFDTI